MRTHRLLDAMARTTMESRSLYVSAYEAVLLAIAGIRFQGNATHLRTSSSGNAADSTSNFLHLIITDVVPMRQYVKLSGLSSPHARLARSADTGSLCVLFVSRLAACVPGASITREGS